MPYKWCPYKKMKFGQKDTHRKTLQVDQGRGWVRAATRIAKGSRHPLEAGPGAWSTSPAGLRKEPALLTRRC